VGRFIFVRARQAAIVIFAVVTLAFVLAHAAPGDPFWAIDDSQMAAAEQARLRAQWGYDQPVHIQYGRWLVNIARGDFGWSHSRNQFVSDVLLDVVPNTLLLMVPALVLGLLAGVALGTWQAARWGRVPARIADVATLTIVSVPDFIVAVVMLTVFAVQWRLAPLSGMTNAVMHASMSFFGRVGDVLAHLVLPALTLALLVAASVSRYQRSAMLGVLHADFLRTARATGASEMRVVLRHGLRNALGPVITIGGLLLPLMFAGTVFIERVFSWPGMGRTLVDAVAGRDYHLVQAVVLIGTTLVTVAGAASDIIAVIANPRTRLDA
jgi:peptide/nickel transport system permease protein